MPVRLQTARWLLTAVLLAAGLMIGVSRHFGVTEIHDADAARSFPLALAPATADDWPELRGPLPNRTFAGDGFPTPIRRTSQPDWQVNLPGSPGSGACLRGELAFVPVVDADQQTVSLWALDRDGGSAKWRTVLHRGVQIEPAAASDAAMPACDGQTAFLAASVDGRLIVSAVGLDGSCRWQSDAGPIAGDNGRILAPMLEESLVIVAVDPPQEFWRRRLTPGYLAAIHRQSGEIVWRVPRGNVTHLSPPIRAWLHRRPQLVSPADGEICSYDPRTGERLWAWTWEATDVGDAAAWDRDRIYVAIRKPQPAIMALDFSDAEQSSPSIAWQSDARHGPIAGLVLAQSSLMALYEDGELTSVDAESGKQLWRRRLPGTFAVAPLLAGQQLLCINSNGLAVTLDLQQRGKTISEEPLGTGVIGPIAATRRQLLFRTETGLACFPWSAAEPPLAITPDKPPNRL